MSTVSETLSACRVTAVFAQVATEQLSLEASAESGKSTEEAEGHVRSQARTVVHADALFAAASSGRPAGQSRCETVESELAVAAVHHGIETAPGAHPGPATSTAQRVHS